MKFSHSIEASVSLDKVSLSSSTTDPFVDLDPELAEYKREAWRKPASTRTKPSHEKKTHQICENYKWIAIYFHRRSRNRLRICTGKRRNSSFIPSLILIFDSSFLQPLLYKDVERVLLSFQQRKGISFSVREVHVAVDLSAPKGTRLYDMIFNSIRAGKKGAPSDDYDYKTSKIFGSPRSASQLALYDKWQEQWDRYRIDLREDVVRVEPRLKITQHRGFPFPRSLREIGGMDWSFLHPALFSFHQPTSKLQTLLNQQELGRPIWELRDLMRERYGVTSSNFYRDCLKDEPRFSKLVAKALAKYRWNPMARLSK